MIPSNLDIDLAGPTAIFSIDQNELLIGGCGVEAANGFTLNYATPINLDADGNFSFNPDWVTDISYDII